MDTWAYRIIQVLSTIVLIVAVVSLSIVLMWLIQGHGVIACGRGVFDDPAWFLDIVVLVGVPASLIVGSGALILWSSLRISET